MQILKTTFAIALTATLINGCNDTPQPTGDDEPEAFEAAETSPPRPAYEIDYSAGETWLCLPGRDDACTVNLDTTVIAADGGRTIETFSRAEDPAFDCFYVYPTISGDPTGNSDMEAGPGELGAVRAQFARYGAQCRTFAPIYRQITLTALRSRFTENPLPIAINRGYEDVRAAWQWYMENENEGRGVLLIGHSQGSAMLSRLIKEEIDGTPLQDQIIAAHLIGARIAVPDGQTTGGLFETFPLCTKTAEAGCLVTFSAFRDTLPPPETTRFGRVPEEGMIAACNNPAAIEGGKVELHAYLSSGATVTGLGGLAPDHWTSTGAEITTPFVSLPGMLSAECINDGKANYLAVTVHGDPDDPRTDDIAGDVVRDGVLDAEWGLHLIDMHLAMGDLVALSEVQYETWAKGGDD